MDFEYKEKSEWGPRFWYVMRCVANNHPESPTAEQQTNARCFLENLAHVLPCPECSQHYLNFISSNPLHQAVLSKKTLVEWIDKAYVNSKNPQVISRQLQSSTTAPVIRRRGGATHMKSLASKSRYRPKTSVCGCR